MIIGMNGGEAEVPEENLYILSYPNDILDGMLIDLPEQYGFVSEHDDEREVMIQTALDSGAEMYEMDEAKEIDYDSPPHSWVVRGVEKLIVETAEDVCKEAWDNPPLLNTDDLITELYEHRKYAIDSECTYNIRQEHWLAIDGILDQINKNVNNEVGNDGTTG